MKKILMVLLMAFVFAGAARADKYTLDRSNLPQEAQEMLTKYFPKGKVAMIKVDRHLLKKTDYDVKLVNGTKIEFSNKGKWTSVDCKTREVPEGLVMKPIRNYLNKNFAGQKVVKIKKKSSGYEVTLDDGVELKFNLLGGFSKVMGVDD